MLARLWSGVTCSRVVIHSSQPWPLPASLMIGAIAQPAPGEGARIDLGNDPKLEDAKWFTMETVKEALETGVSGLGEPASEGWAEGGLRLPHQTAIANRLLTAVCEGLRIRAGGGHNTTVAHVQHHRGTRTIEVVINPACTRHNNCTKFERELHTPP